MVETSIKIASRYSELRRLLRLVDDFRAQHKIPHSVWYCVRLALEEIISNSLKYTDAKKPGQIEVRLARNARELTLRIEDQAGRFNPFEHINANRQAGTLADKARGGHGLWLVKNMMDEVKYRRYRQKNIVTLKKKIV